MREREITEKIEKKFLPAIICLPIFIVILIFHPVTEASDFTQADMSINGLTVSYSSETGSITIKHKTTEDKKYQVKLKSESKIGLLIQVTSSEFTYSLHFLDEGEEWPRKETFKKKTYESRSMTSLPGWVVCIVFEKKEKRVCDIND